MTEASILTLAYILDLLIGDPRWLPHPVRGIGWAIEKIEKMLRKNLEHRTQNTDKQEMTKKLKEKQSGVLLVMIVVGTTYGLICFVNAMLLAPHLPVLISYLASILFIYLASTTIATRDLLESAQDVIKEVNAGNIGNARKKLGMIVGRDTNSLEEKGILKAVIETLSENTSDGIVAPIFYYAIGGLPLAMTYKAINTLDSMVGYKNEKYRNFGWAAARLDDIANYIPARITGLLIVAAGTILSSVKKWSFYGKGTFKIMLRDGRKHSSLNSGIPEAAMAGALGVRLGGPSTYKGAIIEKPYIGEEKHNTDYRTALKEALTITKLTSFLGLLCALAVIGSWK